MEGMKEPIVEEGPTPSEEEVSKAISASVEDAIASSKGRVGILLSGGVDSTLLLKFATRHSRIPVFTIATDLGHPDLEVAERVAKEYGLEHYVLLPGKEDLTRARQAISSRSKIYEGDAAVYLALELAKSEGVGTILATEGVDELAGGYWWHANTSSRFQSRKDAFEYFWSRLGPEHVEPLLESAERVGIEVKFPFLDSRVVSVLNRIPLGKRAGRGVTKSWWKKFASGYIPEYVVRRPKVGFVSALDESVTATLPSAIQYGTDYLVSERRSRRTRRSPRTGKAGSSLGQISCGEVRLDERE